MTQASYSIKVVVQQTGLSSHVIRIWEKRYGAVVPLRTNSNRRAYSDAEIERLLLLREATHAGHAIGSIASLPNDCLLRLIKGGSSSTLGDACPEEVQNRCMVAIRALNTRELEDVLQLGLLHLGQHGILERVIGPLAKTIGDLWREGIITAAHEHFASAIIRNFLVRNYKPFSQSADMPTLVVGTPAGQLHELGAVMVAAAANDLGWRVIYLGAGLPAAEIAGAALQNKARAVALSIVYPTDDPGLPEELRRLRSHLGSIPVIVGGRAAVAYAGVIEEIKADHPATLSALSKRLDAIREAAERAPIRAQGNSRTDPQS